NQGASPLSNLTNFTEVGVFNVTGFYSGNENYTSDFETWWVTVTSDQFPVVNVTFPLNQTYNVDVTELNYTATDDNSVSACWYSLDGGATNSSPDFTCSNFTSLTSIQGSNNWTVYANDSINQISSDVVFFFKDTIFPQFTNHQRNPVTPNEDQNVQINVTVTETNPDTVILEFNNGTATNYTVTTNNGDEFFYTIGTGNYTAHDSVNYSWYANDTAGNLNKSSLQSFTVANQIPSVSAPGLNDTTPLTNYIISCNGGDFSDNDNEDIEQDRFFRWYDTDVEISGETLQTLDLSVSGLDKGDVIKCSTRVYDGFDNSSWVNSSNTATIQNSPPVITNPLTTINWNANGTTFTYDYDYTDDDSDGETWYDNTTLFDINGTGYVSDTPTESEAGIYEIKINVSDGTINTTDDFTYTINDVTLPNISFVSPTEANDSQLTRNYIQVNVTASDGKALDTITIFLYNSTSLVQTNTSSTSPFLSNFTNLPDAIYYFNSTANDTAGNTNQTETRTSTIDTGPPIINYVSPTETSGVSRARNYIEINVTASDPKLDKIIIRLYNSSNIQINSATTSTSPNFINFTLSDGLYFYNATANDTLSQENSTATRNITLDTAVPLIEFVSPTENNNTVFNNRDWVFVNVSVTETSPRNITYILFNSTEKVNETTFLMTDQFSNNTINFTGLPEETYYYNVTIVDAISNSNSTETRIIHLTTLSLFFNGIEGNIDAELNSSINL
ncbi:hypothetical protein LCGC14_2017530, partial [marine sediment metagenome]